MSFPLDADDHNPPEPKEFYVPCIECNGAVPARPIDDKDEDMRSLVLIAIEQCECGEPLCYDCQKRYGTCCQGDACIPTEKSASGGCRTPKSKQ